MTHLTRFPGRATVVVGSRRPRIAALAGGVLLAGTLLSACGTSTAEEAPATVTTTVTAAPSTTKTTTLTETVTEVSTSVETVTEEPVPAADVNVSGAGADAYAEPTPPVAAGFAAVPAPVPQQSGPFKNCSAARAAGAAPVYLGDPGYGSHLDRDGDGIGCE